MINIDELLNIIKDKDNHYTEYASYNGKIAIKIDGKVILFIDPDDAENGEFLKAMGPMNTPKFNQKTVKYIMDNVNKNEYTRLKLAKLVNKRIGFPFPAFVAESSTGKYVRPHIDKWILRLFDFDLILARFFLPIDYELSRPAVVKNYCDDTVALICYSEIQTGINIGDII